MADRKAILITIGIVMIISIILLGFFAIPVGINLCALIGIVFGIKYKDKTFLKWSIAGLLIGILSLIYTLFTIHSM